MRSPSQWSSLQQWAEMDPSFCRDVERLRCTWVTDHSGLVHSTSGHEVAGAEQAGSLGEVSRSTRCRCATVARVAGPQGVALATLAQTMLGYLGGSAEWALSAASNPGQALVQARRCQASLSRTSDSGASLAYARAGDIAQRALDILTTSSAEQHRVRAAAAEVLRSCEDSPLAELYSLLAASEGAVARKAEALARACDGSLAWQDSMLSLVPEVASAMRYDGRSLASLPEGEVASLIAAGSDLARAVSRVFSDVLARRVVAAGQWFASEVERLAVDRLEVLVVANVDLVSAVRDEYEVYRHSHHSHVLVTPYAVGRHLVAAASPRFFTVPWAVADPALSSLELDIVETLVADSILHSGVSSVDLPHLIQVSRRLAA